MCVYICMYVWVYVHVLLLQFLTDFLQTGTKLFQIFLVLIWSSRIFYIPPWGGTLMVFLSYTLSCASDRFLTFTKMIEEVKTDKKAIVTFSPTVTRLPENMLFLGTISLSRNDTTVYA